jgi:hypothetical protein
MAVILDTVLCDVYGSNSTGWIANAAELDAALDLLSPIPCVELSNYRKSSYRKAWP